MVVVKWILIGIAILFLIVICACLWSALCIAGKVDAMQEQQYIERNSDE